MKQQVDQNVTQEEIEPSEFNQKMLKGSQLMTCDSWEDLSRLPFATVGTKETGELDLNDELQSMHDVTCYNIFKKRCKKGRKYKEWRTDAIREEDKN
jgi:hypothetical protein